MSQAGYEKLEEAWAEGSALRPIVAAALQLHVFGRLGACADWRACLTDIFGAEVS